MLANFTTLLITIFSPNLIKRKHSIVDVFMINYSSSIFSDASAKRLDIKAGMHY